jgi:hypothetical protein
MSCNLKLPNLENNLDVSTLNIFSRRINTVEKIIHPNERRGIRKRENGTFIELWDMYNSGSVEERK